MPIRGKISEFIDFDALTAEKQKASDAIAEFIAQVNKGANIQIKLSTSEKPSEVAKGFNELTTATQKVTAASSQFVDSQKNIATSIANLTQSIEQNIQARIRYQNTLASVKAEEKDNLELLKAGTITQKEYRERLIETGLQQEKLKLKISETSKEIKLQTELAEIAKKAPNSIGGAQVENQIVRSKRNVTDTNDIDRIAELNAILDRNNKLIDDNSDKLARTKINIGNYSQSFKTALTTIEEELIKVNAAIAGGATGKELENLTKKQAALTTVTQITGSNFTTLTSQTSAFQEASKQLGLTYGTNSTVFKEFNKNVGAGTKEVSAITKSVKDAGTEGTKAAGGIGKILGPFRTLANILPGIGLSGLFLLGFEAISKAAEALGLFTSKLTETARQREILSKLTEKAAQDGAKESASLKILRADIESTTVPMATRLQAVKDIQKEYPDYFKGLTNEQILTGKVGNAYDLAAAAILRKAKASAASSQIEANSAKQLTILLKDQQDVSETTEKLKNAHARTDIVIGGGGTTGANLNSGISVSLASVKKEINDEFKLRQKARIEENDAIQKDNDFLLKFTTEGAKETVKIDKVKNDKVRESTKASLDSEFEIYKITQLRKIKLLEDGVNDDKKTFDERIALLQQFSTESLALVDAQLKEDLRKNDEKEAALQANLKKAKGTERNNLLIEIANNETARKVIEGKAANDRLAVFDANEKKFTDITEKENDRRLKLQKAAFDRVIKLIEDNGFKKKEALEKQYATDLSDLQNSFDNGEISQRKFNSRRIDIEFNYARESLLIEIDTTKKKLAVSALLPTEKGEALSKLAKLEAQLADLSLKHFRDTEKAKLQAALDTLGSIQKTANDVFSVIDGLINASAINQKNILEAQAEAAEKKAARDIDIVNASTRSEQDKANAITIINARLAAQKDQINRKEKQTELDRARFQKASNIFNIVLSTAQAIIKQLATTPLPFGAGFVAAVAALGAAQLAVAIATPIPKYKDGTGNATHPGGLALVGDGFKKEMTVAPDGSIGITPAYPTVMDLKKGTTVFPDAEKMMHAMMVHHMQQTLAATGKTDIVGQAFPVEHFDKTMKAGFVSIVNAVKNQPRITLKGKTGYDIMFGHGDSEIKYLNNNLQGK